MRAHSRRHTLTHCSYVAFADVFGRDPLELWLLGGLAVVILAALARTAFQRRALRGHTRDSDPLLVFPEDVMRRPVTPAPMEDLAREPEDSEGSSDSDPLEKPTSSQPEAEERGDPAPLHSSPPAPPFRPRPSPSQPAPLQPWLRSELPTGQAAAPQWSSPAPHPTRAPVDEASETIRLPTAADGTVQLLPGRLVMTEGPEVGREYRFLRMANQPVPQVTIGRVSGPAYRHIQLSAVTVSRMHASIRYESGNWHIANLSTTNPVRLNGRELIPAQETALVDGDRIQLGEVELSYFDGRS